MKKHEATNWLKEADSIAILPDGQKTDNNRFTSKMEKKLKREQRKLSKRALLSKKNGINLSESKTIKNKNGKSLNYMKKL